MRKAFLLAWVLVLLSAVAPAAQTAAQNPGPDWSAFQFVLGEWFGEAGGEPGQGTGSFRFASELQGRILVRHSRTVFPGSQNQPALVHDDLLIVYQEKEGTKAVYWDNEGHVIRYEVTVGTDGSLSFISPRVPGAPRQRLTYRLLPDGRLSTSFALASPDKPDEFKVHVEGISRRKQT